MPNLYDILKASKTNIVLEDYYENLFAKTFNKNGSVINQYRKLNYIQSTGTQFIDLDFYGTSNDGAYIEYAYTSIGQNVSARLFGTRDGAGGISAFAFISSSSGNTANSRFYISSNGIAPNDAQITMPEIDTNWHTISINTLNDKNVFFDDERLFAGNDTYYMSTNKVSLFRTYNINSYGAPAVARIKKLKIYQNGKINFDLIPVANKATNIIGLFDLINKKFLTNQGTGYFVAGEILPEEYTQIGYIQSNGNEWFNANYIPTGDEIFEIQFDYVTAPTATKWIRFFGCREGSSATAETNCWIGLNYQGTIFSRFGTQNLAQNPNMSTGNYYRIIVDLKTKKLTINDTIYEFSDSEIANITKSIYVLNVNTETQIAGGGVINLRRFIISRNGKNKRDFVPCKNSNNIEGLYDMVTNTFFEKQN